MMALVGCGAQCVACCMQINKIYLRECSNVVWPGASPGRTRAQPLSPCDCLERQQCQALTALNISSAKRYCLLASRNHTPLMMLCCARGGQTGSRRAGQVAEAGGQGCKSTCKKVGKDERKAPRVGVEAQCGPGWRRWWWCILIITACFSDEQRASAVFSPYRQGDRRQNAR
jgi:hypothetical protein